MASRTLIEQILANFGEQLQSRQQQFAPAIEQASNKLREASINIHDSARRMTEAAGRLHEARKSAAAIPGMRSSLVKVNVQLSRAKRRLSHARTAGVGVKRAEQMVQQIQKRREEVSSQLDKAQEAKRQLGRLHDETIRRRLEHEETKKTENTLQRNLEQITNRSSFFGAVVESSPAALAAAARSGVRGGEIGGAAGLLGAAGNVASAVPGYGSAIGATLMLTGGLLKATDALGRWTKGVIDSNTQLGTASPSMAAVETNEMLRQFFRDYRQGEARAGATEDLSRSFDEFMRRTESFRNSWSNLWDSVGSRLLEWLNTILPEPSSPSSDFSAEDRQRLGLNEPPQEEVPPHLREYGRLDPRRYMRDVEWLYDRATGGPARREEEKKNREDEEYQRQANQFDSEWTYDYGLPNRFRQ